MKFTGVAIPKPTVGYRITEKPQVVPDQSLSLEEILRRFTRGEALPLGKDTFAGEDEEEHDMQYDLEKLKHADLTIRDEVKAKAEEVIATRKKEEAERDKRKAEAKKKKDAEAYQKKIDEEVEKRLKSRPA